MTSLISYKNQIILGVVLAVIIGSAVGVGVYMYLPSGPNSSYSGYVQNGTTISGGNCSQSFSSGLPVSDYSSNKSIVFLMQPNMTAQICVKYRVQKVTITSPATFTIFPYGVLKAQITCSSDGSCLGTTQSANFTNVVSPSSITIPSDNSASQVVLVYTIHSGNSSKGFYSFSYLNSCEKYVPLAVGYNSSQVNASDFNGFFMPNFGCGQPGYSGYQDYLSNGIVTGITNLSFTYIPVSFTG